MGEDGRHPSKIRHLHVAASDEVKHDAFTFVSSSIDAANRAEPVLAREPEARDRSELNFAGRIVYAVTLDPTSFPRKPRQVDLGLVQLDSRASSHLDGKLLERPSPPRELEPRVGREGIGRPDISYGPYRAAQERVDEALRRVPQGMEIGGKADQVVAHLARGDEGGDKEHKVRGKGQEQPGHPEEAVDRDEEAAARESLLEWRDRRRPYRESRAGPVPRHREGTSL